MYTCIYGHAGLVFQRFQIIYKMKLMAAWKIWGFVAIFLAMNGLQPKGSNFFLLFGCFIFSIFTVPALLTVVAIAGVVRCRLFFNAEAQRNLRFSNLSTTQRQRSFSLDFIRNKSPISGTTEF